MDSRRNSGWLSTIIPHGINTVQPPGRIRWISSYMSHIGWRGYWWSGKGLYHILTSSNHAVSPHFCLLSVMIYTNVGWPNPNFGWQNSISSRKNTCITQIQKKKTSPNSTLHDTFFCVPRYGTGTAWVWVTWMYLSWVTTWRWHEGWCCFP